MLSSRQAVHRGTLHASKALRSVRQRYYSGVLTESRRAFLAPVAVRQTDIVCIKKHVDQFECSYRFSSSFSPEEVIPTPTNRSDEDSATSMHTYSEDPRQRIKLRKSDPLFVKVNQVIDLPIGTLHPLDLSFTCVELMIDCCKVRTLEGMKYARDMLDRMLSEKKHCNNETETGGDVIVIPAKAFERYLYGWAQMARYVQVAPNRMYEVIDLMAQEHEYDLKLKAVAKSADETSTSEEKQLSCQPTVYTFNIILRGLAEASRRTPECASDAYALLATMKNYHEKKGWHTKPNTRSFTHVMTAFANSNDGPKAGRLLERLKALHKSEKEKYELNFGTPYNTLDPKANVIQIVTPDHFIYSAAISAYANSGALHGAQNAEKLLHEVLEDKDIQVETDTQVFASTINAWAKLAKAPSPKARFEAADRAEKILLLMLENVNEEESNPAGNVHENVDHNSQQDRVKSFTVAFNSVLNAWAKSDIRESAPRAEELLHQMLEASLSDNPTIRPDVVSFNTVINAWARFFPYDTESPRKAEDLLNLMYDLYNAGTLEENALPDTKTYSSLITAWAKGGAGSEKIVNARRILDSMLDQYEDGNKNVKPSASSFTSVLTAAARSPPSAPLCPTPTTDSQDEFGDSSLNDPVDAYSIALSTYEELCNDAFALNVKPDHFTFAAMLQVIEAHTDASSTERRQMVERIFDDACSRGQVSALVVTAAKNACPIDILARLLGSLNLAQHLRNVDELPRDWTRNVGKHRRFRDMREVRLQGEHVKGRKRKPKPKS